MSSTLSLIRESEEEERHHEKNESDQTDDRRLSHIHRINPLFKPTVCVNTPSVTYPSRQVGNIYLGLTKSAVIILSEFYMVAAFLYSLVF